MAISLRQKLTVIPLALYWPAIFILGHIPIPQLVYRARVSDKSLHFIAYLVLVFLLWFVISPDRKVNWRKAAAWWVLFVVAWYGAADELLQSFVGRSCDAMDFLSNLAGTLAGLILFTFLTFWPALLAVTAIIVFLLTNLASTNPAELMPRASIAFYLFAYGFLTMLWVWNMRLFLSPKAPRPKWLMAALVPPIVFLLTVKVFAVMLGKPFSTTGVIISAAGIAIVVAAVYLTALLGRRLKRKISPGDSERPV
jgi:VanZ family protein